MVRIKVISLPHEGRTKEEEIHGAIPGDIVLQNCDSDLKNSLWGTFADNKGTGNGPCPKVLVQRSITRPPNKPLVTVLLWFVRLGYGKQR